MKELDIRYSEIKDGQYILKWLLNKDMARYYPPAGDRERSIFVNNWIGFSKFRASLTVVLNDEVCGVGTLLLMPYKKVSHSCNLYMITDPLKKNEEIYFSLLKNMINLAYNYFKLESVVAEVFEGCFLINVLEKFDFELFARQKGYVKDNGYLDRLLYQHLKKA